MRMAGISLIATLVLASTVWAAPPSQPECEGLPLVFSADFEKEDASQFEMTDEKAWKVRTRDGEKVLSLRRASKYEPAVRSPKNIAWIKDLEVTDFVMDVACRQTGKEYGHRDLCFFFNGEDASHFYYVHLATKADDHANSIFLVDGAPRTSIAKERTKGTDWGKTLQKVRIKRDTKTGRIEVFYNDMKTPVMWTVDKTFLKGKLGIGSFDDTGDFYSITVWGNQEEAPKK